MPYTPPGVYYSATQNGTYTAITGVQSISINRGRKRITDPFPGSSCVIELIPANSYTLPFAIGQFVDIRTSNSTSAPCYFAGKIIDVYRKYDFPYKSSTGAAPGDRITLTVAGATGILATNYNTVTWAADADSYPAVVATTISANVNAGGTGPDLQPVAISAQTVTAGNLDTLNTIINGAQWYIDDGDAQRGSTEFGESRLLLYMISSANITFSDNGTGYGMKGLDFGSSIQDTFSQVNVQAQGLALQKANSGTPPYNSVNINTYNQTTAQALLLANYLYSLNSGQLTACPDSITTDTTLSTSVVDLVKIYLGDLGPLGAIGAPVSVVFRGSTSTGTIQGLSANFYMDYAQVTVYLSPGLGRPFTLDSSSFGILNTNRLGYP